ncbi:lipoyl protein ligase domain-containing protein [Oleiharenicola lentus]|uniref:lipoyl protein ligase domain-containing protein n=1 Tax=Oleiharenicola lentus TaxID=2508720 RepID=UPI003F665985
MKLHVLPVRTAGAAENMAVDFLLLQRYPEATVPRFRHYEWRTQAFTFGYSQKIEFVRSQLPPDETFDLTRRATGGGVVDHRNDWTYALVIPRGHALYDAPAPQSYRLIHECLANALTALGQRVEVKLKCDSECAVGPDLRAGGRANEDGPLGDRALPKAGLIAGVCFQRAELYDVVSSATGAKIAGAAQKRNKHGLLFQGSIEKNALGAMAWDDFQMRFVDALAKALGADAVETPWPEFNEDELSGLVEHYSATEWVEYR